MSVIVQALMLLALLFICVELATINNALVTINNNLFELCKMVQAIYRKGGEEE